MMYYKYNPFLVSSERWVLSSHMKMIRFFLRSLLFAVVVLYCTFFLAVATPFFPSHFLAVYLCGASLILFRLLCFLQGLSHYLRSANVSLHFLDTLCVCRFNEKKTEIRYDDIEYVAVHFLRACTIVTAEKRLSIPLHMLTRDEYLDFLSNFEELMPERAAMIRRIRDSAEALFTATLLAVHIIQFLVQNYYIPTESMSTTLIENDNIFAEKISYGVRVPRMAGMKSELVLHPFSRQPRRGEIVIFVPPEGENQSHEYIKRVIALPGDDLRISGGKVILNGQLLDEPYVTGETTLNFTGFSIEGTVPDGKVVVMGDNRMNSRDSRVFGYLPLENIRGRALFLYFNWTHIKEFDFSRFGPIR